MNTGETLPLFCGFGNPIAICKSCETFLTEYASDLLQFPRYLKKIVGIMAVSANTYRWKWQTQINLHNARIKYDVDFFKRIDELERKLTARLRE